MTTGEPKICEEWNIRKMSLFSSILRDDFNDNSDIDILIQFNPDVRQGLLTLLNFPPYIDTTFALKSYL